MKEVMFNTTKNYLILGENKTGKTKLGKNLISNICEKNVTFDLFNEKDTPFELLVSEKSKTGIFFDNYSTKDKKNKNIKDLLNNKTKGVVISAPYPISPNEIKFYFDYIFISKIKNKDTLKMIYNIHFKHHDFTYEKFEELNERTQHFIVIDRKNSGFGYYNPKKGFTQEIINTFYEKFTNWLT